MIEREERNANQLSLCHVSDEMESNESMFEFLPYSNLAHWIYDTSIYEEAFQFLPIGRLHQVRSLSFLSYLGKDRAALYYPCPSTHTRLDHSIVVAMVSEEILKQNGFPKEDINKGILAGLVHDIATPAHGDATKKVDPKNLDEEEFWAETIGQEGLSYLQKYEVNEEEMDQIVHNQGILGKVLDVADRITYTMKDVFNLYNMIIFPRREEDLIFFPVYEIISRNPKIGDIYKDVNIKRSTGEVFFSDPEKLIDFLTLRAVMSKNYYYNPSSQGRDLLVKKLVEHIYAKDGSKPLTPQILRSIGDDKLLNIISDHYNVGPSFYIYTELVNWHPEYEIFETEEEVKIREEELGKDSSLWTIGTVYCKGFNTAVDTPVFHEGKIMPIKQALPWKTDVLEEMSDAVKGYYVFYSRRGENNIADLLLEKLSKKTN